MKLQTFLILVGSVFGVIALLHLFRLLFQWEAVIGGWQVPLWFSWLGIIVAAYLSLVSFWLLKKN